MNRFEIDGRPTMGGPLRAPGSSGGFTPNQALAAQAAWFIDPVNGSNFNNGKTLATAIRTRSEFYRRMANVTLTQAVTATITSSLASTDTIRSTIYENVLNGFTLTFVGVPTPLFTLNSLVITAYTAATGVGNGVTKMTCAALPAANSWSSVIGKTVDFVLAGNAVRAIVIADLGAKQAWISPPVTQTGANTDFVNGQTVNVWDNPFLPGSEYVYGEAVNYKYLTAATWEVACGVSLLTSCYGGIVLYSGDVGLIACAGIGVTSNPTSNMTSLGGLLNIYGGRTRAIAAGGPVRFNAHSTVVNRGMQSELSEMTTPGNGGVPANIEFQGTAALDSMAYCSSVPGGRIIYTGFVYGTAVDPTLVQIDSTTSRVVFDKLPTVVGATDIKFTLSGKTAKVAWLATGQIDDQVHNNAVIGPAGPDIIDQTVRYNASLVAQGLLTETYNRQVDSASSLMIGGTVYYVALGLKAGDIVTAMYMNCLVGGTAMTLSKMGLYDALGNRLALSADQGAAWATTGLLTAAMIAPFTVQATGLYYAAAVAAATILPTLGRLALATSAPLAGKSPPFGFQTGQVDLPVAGVISTTTPPTAGPLAFWFGIS